MSGFQPQPVSIDWHVRDKDKYGILKVYLFQKIPESNPIVRWKNALVEKLNQYNRANYANRGLFTENADGSTTSDYPDQSYTLGPLPNQANYEHFHELHEKYKSDKGRFCGNSMNPNYLHDSVEANHICMYITDDSTGEERLHSVVTFIIEKTTQIYIDVFCTCTEPKYVNFRGGYRLMSLLYGICRLLGMIIRLHSLVSAMKFYEEWGYKLTNSTGSLPEYTSSCALRNRLSFKDVAKTVFFANRIQANRQDAQADAPANAEHIQDILSSEIRNLDRKNSGEPEDEYVFLLTDVNRGLWKVSNKVFDDKGKVISYDLYTEDDEGDIKYLICVPVQKVETMDEHRERGFSEKYHNASKRTNGIRKREVANASIRKVQKDTSLNKRRAKTLPWSHEDDKQITWGTSGDGTWGGSKKRKTKKRKTKRNSKKNKKNI